MATHLATFAEAMAFPEPLKAIDLLKPSWGVLFGFGKVCGFLLDGVGMACSEGFLFATNGFGVVLFVDS